MSQSLRLTADRTTEHTTSGASDRSPALQTWEKILTAREADVGRVNMVLDMTPTVSKVYIFFRVAFDALAQSFQYKDDY